MPPTTTGGRQRYVYAGYCIAATSVLLLTQNYRRAGLRPVAVAGRYWPYAIDVVDAGNHYTTNINVVNIAVPDGQQCSSGYGYGKYDEQMACLSVGWNLVILTFRVYSNTAQIDNGPAICRAIHVSGWMNWHRILTDEETTLLVTCIYCCQTQVSGANLLQQPAKL